MSTTSINREALLKTLGLLRPALAAQDYIPALQHVCFDEDGYATAYNDISAISVKLDCVIDRCVPGDLLIRTLGSFNGATVALAYDATKSTLLLSSGRSKLKLPTLDLASFPFQVPTEAGPEIVMTRDMLKGIERCLISVGSDPTHPAQMGVTLDPDDKGHAVLFSTDNFTISRYQTSDAVSLPGDSPLIMPTFFCEQLIALQKAYPDATIVLVMLPGALLAELTVATTVVASLFTKTVVDVQPLEFHKIVKKHCDPEKLPGLIKIPDALDSAFSRALLVLSNELDKTTKVAPSDGGRLSLSTTSAMGDADDEIELTEAAAGLVEFLIDPTLVARASKGCDKIAFYKKALVLTDEKARFVHLIAHCAN